MLSHEITSVVGKHKAHGVGRMRAGLGKTAGRGAKTRAGPARGFSLYQGGQIPLFRHLPKQVQQQELRHAVEIVNV
jgi:ribosomal protein L15